MIIDLISAILVSLFSGLIVVIAFGFLLFLANSRLKKPYPEKTTKIISLVIFILASVAFFIFAITDIFYKDTYEVYACPQHDGSSKCYQVKAEYSEGQPEKIFFDNSGYITIEFCDGKTCFAENRDDGTWEITKIKRTWERK
jgi:uncharacterized protein with PQ loop repeat